MGEPLLLEGVPAPATGYLGVPVMSEGVLLVVPWNGARCSYGRLAMAAAEAEAALA